MVYRRLDIEQRPSYLKSNTELRQIGVRMAPRRFMNFVIAFTFLMNLCIMVTSFVTNNRSHIEVFFILCEYQPSRSTKPLLTTTVCISKILKNAGIFQFSYFFGEHLLELENKI